jgi:hypothetical protein
VRRKGEETKGAREASFVVLRGAIRVQPQWQVGLRDVRTDTDVVQTTA